MAARIARHRSERPAHWATLEEPRDLLGAPKDTPEGTCIIIDCVQQLSEIAVLLLGAAIASTGWNRPPWWP